MATEILLWLKVLVARLATIMTMATEDYWQREAQSLVCNKCPMICSAWSISSPPLDGAHIPVLCALIH